MSRQLTIRGVSDEVGRRLESISRERGQSLNATVVAILESAVGFEERRARLARYATWSEEDRLEFEAALAQQRLVDDADWS
jgi:plasmid stability protein